MLRARGGVVGSRTKEGNNPECCDYPDFGLKAAREAGMKCIAIPSGAYTKDELKNENPDLLVDSITEKEKILDFVFE